VVPIHPFYTITRFGRSTSTLLRLRISDDVVEKSLYYCRLTVESTAAAQYASLPSQSVACCDSHHTMHGVEPGHLLRNSFRATVPCPPSLLTTASGNRRNPEYQGSTSVLEERIRGLQGAGWMETQKLPYELVLSFRRGGWTA
jgi:hypothetical protein